MVSTQKTFFPTNRAFPSILAKAHLSPPDCVPAVLDRSSVNRSPTNALEVPSLAKIITKRAETHSRKLLNGLEFDGTTPKSVADLLASGANRNADVITNGHVDETAAFENDVAYYKVLLEARKRHREALQHKLRALRTIRAKKPTIYRKRAAMRRHANATTKNISRSDTTMDPGSQQKLVAIGHWPAPCSSPVSTDIESDASSILDDDTVSVEKPVIYGA